MRQEVHGIPSAPCTRTYRMYGQHEKPIRRLGNSVAADSLLDCVSRRNRIAELRTEEAEKQKKPCPRGWHDKVLKMTS